MATRLQLTVLGGFRLAGANGATITVPWRKGIALLAYLGVTIGTVSPRDRVAYLLWGHSEQRLARQSLRQMLHMLERTLGAGSPPIMRVDSNAVELNAARVWIDAVEFEALLSNGDSAAEDRALALYKGDFLAGFEAGPREFEEWLDATRSYFRDLAMRGLMTQIGRREAAGQVDAASESARQALRIDPFREDVHRSLMRLLMAQGLRGAALAQYRDCEKLLRRELGVSPDTETVRLYDAISAVRAETNDADRVVAPAGGDRATVASRPLIGFDRELTALRRHFSDVETHGARLVAVLGDLGAGKSAILNAFLHQLGKLGATTARARARATQRHLDFVLWTELLGSWPLAASGQRAADQSLTRRLGFVRSRLRARDRRRLGTADDMLAFDAVVELIRGRAANATLVLAIDDIHAADAASLRLLSYVVRNLRSSPVLVLVTARSDQSADEETLLEFWRDMERDGLLHRAALAPLSRSELAALVNAIRRDHGATALSPTRQRDIYALSDGNPGIAVEAARQSVQAGTAIAAIVPETLRGDFQRRISGLDEPTRGVLAAACVFAESIEPALLAQAAQVDRESVARAIDALCKAGVIAADGDRVAFARGRYRLAQYYCLSRVRLQHLHLSAARAIANSASDDSAAKYAALAHHYREAGDADAAVCSELRLGGVRQDRGAYVLARRSYRRALNAAETTADEAAPSDCEMAAALALATVEGISDDFVVALGVLRPREQRLNKIASPVLRAQCLYALACLFGAVGDQASAIAYARRAVDESPDAEDWLWQLADRLLERLHLLSVRLDTAIEQVERARRAARRRKLPATEAELMSIQGLLLAVGGQGERGKAEAKAAVAAASHLRQPALELTATYLCGIVQDWCGDLAAAIESFSAAATMAERRGDLLRLYAVRGWRGHALARAGQPTTAIAELDQCLILGERLGARFWRPLFQTWKAEAMAGAGTVRPALRQGRAALRSAVSANRPWAHSLALRTLGRIMAHADIGNNAGAERMIRAAVAEQESFALDADRAQWHDGRAGILHAGGEVGRPRKRRRDARGARVRQGSEPHS